MGKFAEYESYDAIGLADLVRRKEVTPEELLAEALARTERLNPKLNAVVHAVPEQGAGTDRAAACPMDRSPAYRSCSRIWAARRSAIRPACGSRLFANYQWTFDSEIYLRLKNARAGRPSRARPRRSSASSPVDRGRRLWRPDAQSLESQSHIRRLQRRQRRGGRGRHRSDGPWQRRRRLGAHSRLLLRPVRLKPTRARLPDGPASGEGWGGMAIDGLLSRSVRDTAAALDARHGADLGAPYWAPPVARPYIEEIKTPPRRLRIAVCRTRYQRRADPSRVRRRRWTAPRSSAPISVMRSSRHAPSFDFEKVVRAWTNVVLCGTALSVQTRARRWADKPARTIWSRRSCNACEIAPSVSGTAYLAAINLVHATGRLFAALHAEVRRAAEADAGRAAGGCRPLRHEQSGFSRLPAGSERARSAIRPSPRCSTSPASRRCRCRSIGRQAGLPIGVHFAAKFGDEATLLKLAAQLEQASPWFNRRPVLQP